MAKVFLTLKSSAKTNFNLKKIKLLESHKIPFENTHGEIYLICEESYHSGVSISSREYDKPYSRFCLQLSDSTTGGSIGMGEASFEDVIYSVLYKVFGNSLDFEFTLSCGSDYENKTARIVFNEDENSYEFETEIDEENEEEDMNIDCDRCGSSHLLGVECDCAKIITKVVESPIEFQKEIEKIRKVCIEMEEKDIEYIKWTDYFISKGFKAKINFNLEISLSTFKFMITNKNNKLPIEINFIEGKFAGWIKTK
jgi:hypothetical protein